MYIEAVPSAILFQSASMNYTAGVGRVITFNIFNLNNNCSWCYFLIFKTIKPITRKWYLKTF